ncbi:hypothetical protein BY996DRAFT_4605603, partial [Phakopsora pachyrhizi]
ESNRLRGTTHLTDWLAFKVKNNLNNHIYSCFLTHTQLVRCCMCLSSGVQRTKWPNRSQ